MTKSMNKVFIFPMGNSKSM